MWELTREVRKEGKEIKKNDFWKESEDQGTHCHEKDKSKRGKRGQDSV